MKGEYKLGKDDNINRLFSGIFGPDKNKQLSNKEKKNSLSSYYGVRGLDEKALEKKESIEEEEAALDKRVRVIIKASHKKLSPMLQKIVKETEQELYKER